MKQRILTWALGVAIPVMAAQAHHSISAVYDNSKVANLAGVVTQFQFVNPHPFVMMEVREGNSQVQQWKLEMDTRWELAEIGFNSETLKPGDRLVVTGSLARKQSHSLYIRRLERPADGLTMVNENRSPSLTRRPATTAGRPERQLSR